MGLLYGRAGRLTAENGGFRRADARCLRRLYERAFVTFNAGFGLWLLVRPSV